jgi:hypothetical protein
MLNDCLSQLSSELFPALMTVCLSLEIDEEAMRSLMAREADATKLLDDPEAGVLLDRTAEGLVRVRPRFHGLLLQSDS